MTSIDVTKFADTETRHPHKEILKLLVRHVEFDGDAPLHPTVPREFIVGGAERYDELKSFSVARIERAIDSLVEAEVVEERTDFWSGRRTLGLRNTLTKDEYLAIVEQRFKSADANHDGKLKIDELTSPTGAVLVKLITYQIEGAHPGSR